jgi:DNA-binding PadR family transcriptional regulator
MLAPSTFPLRGGRRVWHDVHARVIRDGPTMSIRHAILGLLAEQPMHGYRLKEAFDRRLSPLWGLTTGQVYQSLQALERAGLVASRGERVGRRPARRVYSVTADGRRELDLWLRETPTVWVRPFREEILIRLMLLREPDAAPLWQSLARQEHEVTLLLARVTRMRDELHGARSGVDLLATFLDGMTVHLEADIKSLQRFRAEIERWARRRKVALPGREGGGESAAIPSRSAPLPSVAHVLSAATPDVTERYAPDPPVVSSPGSLRARRSVAT